MQHDKCPPTEADFPKQTLPRRAIGFGGSAIGVQGTIVGGYVYIRDESFEIESRS